MVDIAAMRDAVLKLGGDPVKVNPVCPSVMVIDHSLPVEFHRSADAEIYFFFRRGAVLTIELFTQEPSALQSFGWWLQSACT